MSKDYYKTLGVEKGASKDEMKRAFRNLAHKHHPDKGGDAEKFKEINEAYQVLSDDSKRSQYDQFGSAGPGGQGFGGMGGFGQGFQGMHFEDLGDIFGDFFGGRTRGRRSRSGSDIQIDVTISFKESVFGVEKEISLSKNDNCKRCAGTGGEPESALKNCEICNGSGVQETIQRTILGAMKSRVSCSSCNGRGEKPEKKCGTCSGSGTVHASKTLRVDFPAGVETGVKIRVRGQGESIGSLGPAGDLYIRIRVTDDARFERHGNDLYVEKAIGFTQAALGDEVSVDTVEGSVKLKIPAGTQPGDQLRLRGKGVQSGRSAGDQIVIINVVTPKKLSRKQKKLMEELDLKI